MDLVSLINTHLTAVDVAFIYLVLSSAVQALPEPTPYDNRFYLFVFKFAHTMVANWKVVGKKEKV